MRNPYSQNKICKCGKLIQNTSINCSRCANTKSVIKRFKNINIFKDKNPNWKGGKPKCVGCGRELSNYYNHRCCACETKRKWKKGLMTIKKGKNHPLYRKIGSIVKASSGYLIIKLNKSWKILHRHLVEQYIGYKLNKKWVIHHIDGNKTNNNLINLYIFTKKELHLSFETCLRNKLTDRNFIKSNLNKFKK
jgi:hypothetical protein